MPASTAWPDSDNDVTLGAPAASGSIDSHTFLVVGTTIYFADHAAGAVYRTGGNGDAPVKVLDADAVEHMTTDGTTLFVQSSCGIQSSGL